MAALVAFLVPETKGVPMEEIQEQLFMKHWFWSRFIKDYWGEGGVRRWSLEEAEAAQKKGAARGGGLALEASAA
jgi:hypothetical protein